MKYTLMIALLASVVSLPALADMHTKHDGKMNNYKDRMWKDMDSNGDGVISAQESDDFSKRKFTERDTNKDGKVTREEWETFYNERRKEMREKMGKKEVEKPAIESAKAVEPAKP